MAIIVFVDGVNKKLVFGSNFIKKCEAGKEFHGVDVAEYFFGGFAFDVIHGFDEFFEPGAEHGMIVIFGGFANICDAIFNGEFTVAETANLRENIPHPVRSFLAGFEFF